MGYEARSCPEDRFSGFRSASRGGAGLPEATDGNFDQPKVALRLTGAP